MSGFRSGDRFVPVGEPITVPGVYTWVDPSKVTVTPCTGYNDGCRICRVIERNRDALEDAKVDLLPDEDGDA